MSKVSLDWRICWMQAEVPFKHLKPGETSQLLLSRQMSLPVIGQCSHLRSTGFFWKVTVITCSASCRCCCGPAPCLWLLSLPVRWHWVLLTWPWEAVTNSGGLLVWVSPSRCLQVPFYEPDLVEHSLGEVCGGERWKLISRSSPVVSQCCRLRRAFSILCAKVICDSCFLHDYSCLQGDVWCHSWTQWCSWGGRLACGMIFLYWEEIALQSILIG